MKATALATFLSLVFAATVAAVAQDAEPIRRGAEPILRVDTGGPSSFVTALAFSPDGRTLHVGGWDKVVRVWSLERKREQQVTAVDELVERFAPSPSAAFRVPIGPGLQGSINALAISADGTWLAVAGEGHATRVANFRESGWILPSAGKTLDIWLDEGTIYLFNRHTREVYRLRGHRGPVFALAFSSLADGNPLLASAAEESYQGKHKGALRLWQVAERKHIGATFLPYTKNRPQLAVLPSGSDPQAVRVAVAWNDGTLRVWDPQSNSLRDQPDGDRNNSVSLLDRTTIVTCSATRNVGHVKFWKLATGAAPQADANRQVDFQNELPRAFALIASRPGQTLDHVAVASLVFEPNGAGKHVPTRMQLRLVSLQPQAFGRTVATTDLWSVDSNTARVPTLAAGGEHLAVAGGPSHEILVYSIRDLLNQQFRPQRLSSRAVAMGDVAFAKKDGELGLLLREQESQRDDFDVVFPLSSGRLEPFHETGDWQQEDAKDWQAQLVVDHIEVRNQDVRIGKDVTWREAERVTDFAVAPPVPPLDVPILALATHEMGMPKLSLFNVQTGEQVFQYTGHTERITAISFSPDFRLLASVGDDRTVCVWSLNDLPEVLGKRGQLLGVAVDQGLKVVNVAPDSPAFGLLNVGDRLTGHVAADHEQVWAGKQSFYEYWRALKPGSELTVRRTRGNATQDVKLPVGQAIDERKPLFSLLITRGEQLADWQWVGWNPLGPFESSDRRIERYLGWHFNTGDPARPTAFAELDQYRDQYFRRGLLRDLARDGELLAEPAPAPRLRPAMALLLSQGEEDQATAEQQIVIRQPLDSVQLALDFAFPATAVRQVTLQIDGRPQGEFRPDTDGTWRADLPDELWKRGSHRLRAILVTDELTPQEFSDELQFRFVPPAPRITSLQPASWSTTEEREALRAEVRPGSVDDPFDVEIHQLVDGRSTSSKRLKGDDPVKIDGGVPLAMGVNVFELVARNRQRVEATEAEETSRRRFVITRFQGPVSPPKIKLDELDVPADGVQDGQQIPLRLGQPVVVTTSRVRVLGSITSTDENLTLAEKFAGDGRTGQSLRQFVANQHKQYKIEDEIELVPGPQVLRYRGQTENSEPTDVELAIEYRPRLPFVHITSPIPGQRVTDFAQKPNFLLEGRLTMPLDRRPYTMAVHVNGEAQEAALEIDEQAGSFRSTVPLRFGDNQIEVRVSNEWHSAPHVQTVNVAYWPAPQIVRIDSPPQVANPFVDLTIWGWSEKKINQVVLDERKLPVDSYGVHPVAGKDKGFRVVIPKLPFQPERESLALRLYAEGVAKPAVSEIVTPKLLQQAATPAEIEIIDPQRNATINEPLYTIRFKVTSQSTLRTVELWQDRRFIYSPEDAGELKAGEFNVPVELAPGTNSFEVVAENEGGLQKEIVTLNHIVGPVSLVVKGFANSKTSDQLIPPAPDSFGTLRFSKPATSNRIFLQGDVRWNDRNDSQLDKKGLKLQLWANGYRQPTVTLEERVAGSLTRSFTVPVILSRDSGNLIEIRIPELPRESASRFLLDVDCEAPLTKKRLHLFVVGVGASDGKALVDSALRAVKGKRKGKGFTTAAFSDGKIHTPLIGPDVKESRILPALVIIQRKVRQFLETEGTRANDVVLVYYQGGAMAYEGGQFFLTTQSTKDPALRNAIVDKVGLKSLSRWMEKCCGAQLLLVDVNGPVAQGAASDETWPTTSNAAMLRYAWMKDEPAPLSARLIGALDHVKPSSQRLGQLAEELQLAGKTEYADALSYERYVPEMLQELELRRIE